MTQTLINLNSEIQPISIGEKPRFRIQKVFQYPKIIRVLFLIFGAYLVLPIIEVPVLGLSLSAPIFLIIALKCILKPPYPWSKKLSGWILLAIFLWLGIFISTWANGLLSGGVEIGQGGILTVIRYIYWLLVFVITAHFFSKIRMIKKLVMVLGWAVFLLALLRCYEIFQFGNIGSATRTQFLTQNSYGFIFSTFSPFLISVPFFTKGWKRILAILGNFFLLGAVALNGSRGSWVAISSGLILYLVYTLITDRKRFFSLLLVILVTFGVAVAAWQTFPDLTTRIQQRFNTFDSLDQEKSYMIRQLMIQKGWRLFQDSPIIGVGANRFTLTSTDLDIPRILSYRNQEYFDRTSSHNSYLGFLAEFGLIGTIPFGILLITLGFRGSLSSHNLYKEGHLWALPVLLGFFQMSVHMWVISSLTNTANWFIYGLIASIIMINRLPNEERCV